MRILAAGAAVSHLQHINWEAAIRALGVALAITLLFWVSLKLLERPRDE